MPNKYDKILGEYREDDGKSSGWTDDGTVVRLTIITDQVLIGDTTTAISDAQLILQLANPSIKLYDVSNDCTVHFDNRGGELGLGIIDNFDGSIFSGIQVNLGGEFEYFANNGVNISHHFYLDNDIKFGVESSGIAKAYVGVDTPRITNLTTNGFIKTSGSDGTLDIDTNTYLTGTGTDNSLARWNSGALIDSSLYSDGSNAWAGDGFSVNANITNNGKLEVLSGMGGGIRSFYVDTNNDIVTTNGNVGIGTDTPSVISTYRVVSINSDTAGGLVDFQTAGVSMGYVYNDGSGNLNIDSIPDASIKFNINNGNIGYFTSTGLNFINSIFTVGTQTAYGLGVQVAQDGPALFRIIQTDASSHDGIWSFDAEGDNLYWGTSSQNYCQITRNSGEITAMNLMWGIVDSYQTMAVLPNHVGIKLGASSPTARLHICAGTTAANTAPLKFNSGTNMTTAEAGAVEFTTDDLFFTITTGAARKAFILDNGSRLTSGKIPIATTNGRLINLTASSAYTPSNVTTDRSYNANSTTLDEIADVLGTLIADLQSIGILG